MKEFQSFKIRWKNAVEAKIQKDKLMEEKCQKELTEKQIQTQKKE